MERQNNELEIDFMELLQIFLSRWQVILLTGLLCAVVAFGYSRFVMRPVYQSSTKIYVINRANETGVLSYSDLQSGTQLTRDYSVLVKSRAVLEQVIQEMHLDTTFEAISGSVTVDNPQDTRILSITVSNYDPYAAMDIATKVREVAAEHIRRVMDTGEINVAEEANLPQRPSSPNVRRFALIGGVLGVLASAAFFFLLFMLNDSIKTADDVEKYLGLSVLASVPLNEEQAAAEASRKKARQKMNQKQPAWAAKFMGKGVSSHAAGNN